MDNIKYICNNVYKIKDKEVNYFEVFGKKVQFDEMYELTVDLDESDSRNYAKLKLIYQDGRQPMILTIQEIYDGMQEGKWDGRNPQLPEVKGFNSYIDKNSIRKTKGIYTPKALLFLADELNELMTSDDYKSVDIVKGALGSIARLGRAAGVHLALACQRASGSTISTDLKNNIQMSVLLGGFDDGASQLMFEKDISNLAKPHIKGRGFIGSGNEIIETQTYYTQPEDDWVFDDTQKLSYNNPVFTEQCKRKGIKLEEIDTGWVPQHKIGDVQEEELDEEELNDDEDDFDEDEEIEVVKPTPTKSERPSSEKRERPTRPKNDDDEPIFKFGDDKKKEEPPKPTKADVIKPEVSMSDLEAMFNVQPKTESTRDKVEEALKEVKAPTPVIKLNVDTKNVDKPKIKLNIKPK